MLVLATHTNERTTPVTKLLKSYALLLCSYAIVKNYSLECHTHVRFFSVETCVCFKPIIEEGIPRRGAKDQCRMLGRPGPDSGRSALMGGEAIATLKGAEDGHRILGRPSIRKSFSRIEKPIIFY